MKICLNCGCGMVQDKEANCPVCGKPVKNAEVLKSPFGEKAPEPEAVKAPEAPTVVVAKAVEPAQPMTAEAKPNENNNPTPPNGADSQKAV